MKLRFEVNQAELFRRGIDAPKSIVVIDVHPGNLTQAERNLIADRLSGIDVYTKASLNTPTKKLIRAEGLEFADLMAAIRKDEAL